jgi:hypothetical protein
MFIDFGELDLDAGTVLAERLPGPIIECGAVSATASSTAVPVMSHSSGRANGRGTPCDPDPI